MDSIYQDVVLRGMQIYSEEKIIINGYIKLANQKITELGSTNIPILDDSHCKTLVLPPNYKAIPGFIDIHIHGANGADTMDATQEALDTIAGALPKEGTTSFLATTITQEKSKIEAAIINAAHYIHQPQGPGKAQNLGIHLEGPFINPLRSGAQPKRHIIEPDIELFQKWQSLSNHTIKIVTLAPEVPGAIELIQYMTKTSVLASIGHTDASYDETTKAIQAGAKHVTHLFNQMKGLHHREPGTAGAALLHKELKAEIIADGIHIRPEIAELAYKLKGKEGILLITDSMRAKCLRNGQSELGGQDVFVNHGKAVLKDGTLAGSILKMNQAVNNIQAYTGCSLEEAIEMASVNPAKQLGIFDRKGSINVGKDADIVILDENQEIFMTICRGKIAFQRKQ